MFRNALMPAFLPFVLSALLAASCGGSSAGDPTGEDGVKECYWDDDCAFGQCINQVCVITGDDPDVGTSDTGSKPESDVTSDASESTLDSSAVAPDVASEVIPEVVEEVPAADITVDPTQYMFTYLPGVYNPQTKVVNIYNEGKMSLTVTGISWRPGSSSEFTLMALPPLPKKLNPGEQTSVTVIFKEASPHGNATLVIASNDPDEPEVDVLFQGQSKTGDEPCGQVYPTALNFGQVVRGQTKTLGFEVRNCSSTLPLTITQIKRSTFFGMALTDEFQIDNAPNGFTLGPSQAMPLTVTYAPGLAGIDNGYFTFVPSDASAGEMKLDVYGVGTPPPLEEIGIHVELEWDVDNSDVDLHLIRPGGTLFDCESDCYYANSNPNWGDQNDTMDDPFLDYDDVDGYGPENTNLSEPIPGTYKVAMHYYNDSYEGYTGGATKVTVRVYSYGNLLGTYGPTTLTHTGHMWDVCNIQWPGAAITVLNTLYEAPSQPACFNW